MTIFNRGQFWHLRIDLNWNGVVLVIVEEPFMLKQKNKDSLSLRDIPATIVLT